MQCPKSFGRKTATHESIRFTIVQDVAISQNLLAVVSQLKHLIGDTVGRLPVVIIPVNYEFTTGFGAADVSFLTDQQAIFY